MPVTLGSNIASLRAQRVLGTQADKLGQVFERLSSGQRINRASDDAAGLAVASELNAKSRIFAQGLRNLNDGISALSISDQALANLSDVVIRQRELAEQAANGVFTDEQRLALNTEAQALANEYSRIVEVTEFNGVKLLDGSISGVALQAGVGNDAVLSADILGIATAQQTVMTSTDDLDAFTSNIDDKSSIYGMQVFVEDINSDGRDDFIVFYAQQDDSQNEISIEIETQLQEVDGSFSSAGNRLLANVGVGAKPTSLQGMNVSTGTNEISVGVQLQDSTIEVFSTRYNSAGALNPIANANGFIGVFANSADSINQDLNADGVADTITADREDRSFATSVSRETTVEAGEIQELNQSTFSLATQSSALTALDSLEEDLTRLTNARSGIGASLSRVNTARNVLDVSRENFIQAESRIKDADVAQESSALTRLGILQQAGASVLAQANIQPQLALSLL